MSADILDELELMRFTRIDPIRENAILKRAKDEIVRLRGEACSCPSGDGSLRWQCKAHPPESIAPAEAKDPAPAMPNGVEGSAMGAMASAWLAVTETLNEVCPEWVDRIGCGRDCAVAAIREMASRSAADNRDAAGADGEGWPPCPQCKAGILYECPACSSTNYPPREAAQVQQEAKRHAANEWADMAINGVQWLRNIRDGISTADEALAEMESNLLRVRALNDAARMAAHPSAYELGAVRELVARWRQRWESLIDRGRLGDGYRVAGNNVKLCADELEAALQHRGDSQEVGRV